jgi:hypothetical protein
MKKTDLQFLRELPNSAAITIILNKKRLPNFKLPFIIKIIFFLSYHIIPAKFIS